MAQFYEVIDRRLAARTTREAVDAAGLVRAHTYCLNGHHATAFTAPGPYGEVKAVIVYAAEGRDFTGAKA